jgi:hypothetical protein
MNPPTLDHSIDRSTTMQNAKTCDAATKAAMKYSLAPVSGDNVGAWVQMVSELGQGLKEADGNLEKMYKAYTKNCSNDWDKGLKKLGYTSIIGSAWEKCIDENRSVDDYPMSIKELVKKLQKLVKKQDVLAGLVALIAANNA